MSDIANNRKARHDYEIIETLEAGLVLVGSEVKSIREGNVNIRDGFARIEDDQAVIYGVDIQPWACASHFQHEPKRTRRLLLHRKEITRLERLTYERGHTLVCLRLYWKDRRVKAEIGVAKGKEHKDRRHALKDAQEKREAGREMAQFNRQNG